LREDEEAVPVAQGLRRALEGPARLRPVRPVDGDEPGHAQYVPEEGNVEDLLLRHGLEIEAEALEEDGRVEVAHVVRHHHGVAGVAEVLAALDDDPRPAEDQREADSEAAELVE